MGFEEAVESAIKNRQVPGVVVAAYGPDNFHYVKAFGGSSLNDEEARPLATDALMWMASCTKLQTTIAVLQCVEKGFMTLDEDISRVLPELKDIEILKGFSSNKAPILIKNKTKLTLRHLLTHSSGLSYDHFSPKIKKYLKYHNKGVSKARSSSITEHYRYPLLFEPGTSFGYGAGVDWAGKAVERCTSQSLSDYLATHIWQPLNLTSCTFRPMEDRSKYDKVMSMAERNGGLSRFGTTKSPDAEIIVNRGKHPRDVSVRDDYGGAGILCSVPDYARVLRSLTIDDGKLLTSSTLATMFTPQLSADSKNQLKFLLSFPEVNNSMGGLPSLPPSTPSEIMVDWGLGGQLTPVDIPGRRKKGSLHWGGLPNLFWFVDRESGVCAVFGTQLLPTGDPKCVELWEVFEKAVYQGVELHRKGKDRGKL